MFYSAKTGGFYSEDIHGKNIPEDAKKESQWKFSYDELIQGQSEGKVIAPDKQGFPVLEEPNASPIQIRNQINIQSRLYLSSTDWYLVRNMETGEPVPNDILSLRKKAREAVGDE